MTADQLKHSQIKKNIKDIIAKNNNSKKKIQMKTIKFNQKYINSEQEK